MGALIVALIAGFVLAVCVATLVGRMMWSRGTQLRAPLVRTPHEMVLEARNRVAAKKELAKELLDPELEEVAKELTAQSTLRPDEWRLMLPLAEKTLSWRRRSG